VAKYKLQLKKMSKMTGDVMPHLSGLPYLTLNPGRRGGVRFRREDIDRWLETKRIK
jgi:hypothetical protein